MPRAERGCNRVLHCGFASCIVRPEVGMAPTEGLAVRSKMTVAMLRDALAELPDDALVVTVAGDMGFGYLRRVAGGCRASDYARGDGSTAEVWRVTPESTERGQTEGVPAVFLDPYTEGSPIGDD